MWRGQITAAYGCTSVDVRDETFLQFTVTKSAYRLNKIVASTIEGKKSCRSALRLRLINESVSRAFSFI